MSKSLVPKSLAPQVKGRRISEVIAALLTTDKTMRYQQNFASLKIAIIVLGHPQWPGLRFHVERVLAAVNAAIPGSYSDVDIPG